MNTRNTLNSLLILALALMAADQAGVLTAEFSGVLLLPIGLIAVMTSARGNAGRTLQALEPIPLPENHPFLKPRVFQPQQRSRRSGPDKVWIGFERRLLPRLSV